jgi:dipeptidyl aminopeptidase/acylaminoacyl peptidase
VSKRPITPADLWQLARVGVPVPAPDGSYAVVPVTTYDVEENRGLTRLWKVSGDGQSALTGAEKTVSGPCFSPDGSRLAFMARPAADEEAKPQVYVMPLAGGEAHRVTDLPLGALAVKWMPSGTQLVVMSPVFKDAMTLAAAGEKVQVLKDSKTSVKVTEERMYRFWDRWLTDGDVAHLFLVEADGSGAPVDLTPDLTDHMYLMEPGDAFDVAPDGGEIAYQARSEITGENRQQQAVFTRSTGGGEPRRVSPELPGHENSPLYSPDGRYLLYGMSRQWDFYADRVRLALLDRETGASTILTEDWDRSADGWKFAPDSESILFTAEDGARVNIYSIPTAVKEPELVVAGGTTSLGGVAQDGSIFYSRASLTHPARAEVWLPGETRVLGDFNDDLLSQLDLGEVREFTFAGAGGDEVQSFLMLPPGFDDSRKWPLLHQIHGGPHGIFGDSWHWRWAAPVFAAPGYVVVMVNFHGSTSFGQDFAAGIRGAWGDMPTTDILAATDAVVDMGFVDESRMAITGGSYGGYLAAWLTMKTDRFQAAVVHAGVTNYTAKYAGDITQGLRGAHDGEPWDGLDQMLAWSPTSHTENLVTPTLVIHGEKDYRVPIDQGLELYGILKAKGIEARLVYFPDEGHWILKPQNSLHWYREFLDWLDRFLG